MFYNIVSVTVSHKPFKCGSWDNLRVSGSGQKGGSRREKQVGDTVVSFTKNEMCFKNVFECFSVANAFISKSKNTENKNFLQIRRRQSNRQ
jgi:hypothetical protein